MPPPRRPAPREAGPGRRRYPSRVTFFSLYTFDEDTPGIHVDCLWMIPELVRRHVPR